MRLITRYASAWLFVLLAFVIAVVAYGHLPELVPVHWGLDGQANAWMPRRWGAFALPLCGLGVTLLLAMAPCLFPRDVAVTRIRTYPLIVAIIAAFMLLMTAVQLLAASGAPLPLPRIVCGATGLLLAVIGNYLGKLPRNHLAGIRVPWTLASDEVWERTHRFAAPWFVLGGAAIFLYAVFSEDLRRPWPLLVLLLAIVTIPMAYSYLLWRRLQREG